MSFDEKFNKITTAESYLVKSSNNVECRLPLLEEEAKEVICVDMATYLLSLEVGDGEIRYSGRTVFTILYKSENTIKKCESGVEYSYKFPEEKARANMNVSGWVKGENCSISTLNGIANVSGVVVFNGELTIDKEFQYFEKCDNLLTKYQEKEYLNEILKLEKDFKIEDEFDVDELISNVLIHSEKGYITDCQCGIGSVIVDGEVELTLLVEQLNSLVPKTIQKNIPFRLEIENNGVMPNYQAVCKCLLKGTSLKVYVDENKNKSSISVEVNLQILSKVYEVISFNHVVDAYSPTKEIKINYDSVKLCKFNGFKCCEKTISSELNVNLQENSRLICIINDKIEEINYSVDNNKILVNGVLSIKALFSSQEIYAEDYLIPFEYTCDIEGNVANCFNSVITNIQIKENNSEYIVTFTIKTSFGDIDLDNYKIISSLEEGEDKIVNTSAISVYIPKEGDSLWEVSKVLGVSEEDILKTNKDLSFPLTGEERIVIYRGLSKDN